MPISLTAPTEPALAGLYRDKGWWRPQPLSAGLETVAERDADRPCLIEGERTWTYGEVRAAVGRAVGSLAAAGLGPGDPVLVVAPIAAEAVVTVLAVMRAGGVVVALDRRSGALDVANAVRSSGPRLVVAPAGLRAPLRLDEHGVEVLDAGELARGPERAWTEPDPGAARLVFFTSGTTKRPKGVIHTLETIGAGVRNFADPLGFSDDDRLFLASPLASITGIVQILLAVRGGSIVLEDRFEAERSVGSIERHGVTVIGGAPIIPETVLAECLRQDLRPARLRSVAVGGSMIPRALIDLAVERFDIEAVRMYGSSEVPIHTATSREDPIDERLDDDGRPNPGCECALGHEVGEGHELLVRGPNLFQGYLHDEDNDGAFSGGWFRTGDVVRERAGRIRVLGRLKDTAVRKGLKIALAEVDACAERLPGVVECAAYAVPDAATGERVALALRTTTTTPSYDDLVTKLGKLGLARGKLPEEFVFWDCPLPRNPAGKVVRSELVEAQARFPRVLARRLRAAGVPGDAVAAVAD